MPYNTDTMKISPSILDANFQSLQSEIDSLANADRIHLDIMDGHYVPNMSFGASILQNIQFPVETEAHLMVNNPETFIPLFRDIHVGTIGFHIENTGTTKAIQLLDFIRHHFGIKAGIVVDGYTNIEWLTPEILDRADQVLIMSVKSGFGGQSFMPEALDKIRTLRQKGFQKEIEVDGGVTLDNIQAIKDAGADIVVVGSFLMKHNPTERSDIIRAFQNV
jgi:ribulose-phosphate 3-epimerase